MKAKLLALWYSAHTSLWFVPALMTLAAIGLSLATIALDEAVKHEVVEKIGLLYTGGPEGARAVLSTIAGSMMTVVGIVFSITIVALTLASTQFGPRLLRNFMKDTGNQIVLGTFIATFIYCLLVLRTVRVGNGEDFVPHISVTLAIMLALASIAVLIYFIHHMASSIQASNIIATVGGELDKAIERLFPHMLGREAPDERQASRAEHDILHDFDRRAQRVAATRTGYVQACDSDALMKIAEQRDLILRLDRCMGDFVSQGNVLLTVWAGERIDEDLSKKLNDGFILGNERTLEQDIKFGINQLVEIAVRALSPGVNDPFTANTCVDQLGATLCALAERDIPSPYRYDEQDRLRVIAEPATFADITDAAFNQIRQYAGSSAAVTIRLLETLAVIATRVRKEQDRQAIRRHAVMIERGSREGLPEELDREVVQEKYQAVLKAL